MSNNINIAFGSKIVEGFGQLGAMSLDRSTIAEVRPVQHVVVAIEAVCEGSHPKSFASEPMNQNYGGWLLCHVTIWLSRITSKLSERPLKFADQKTERSKLLNPEYSIFRDLSLIHI